MRGLLRDCAERTINHFPFMRPILNQLLISKRISSVVERWGYNIDIPLCFRPWMLLVFALDLFVMAFLGYVDLN